MTSDHVVYPANMPGPHGIVVIDLAAFLLARINEDEEAGWRDFGDDASPGTWLAWILAEGGAKRRIIARHHRTTADHWSPGSCEGCGWYGPTDHPVTPCDEICPELADLAFAYADHAEYSQEWSLASRIERGVR